MKDVLDFLLRLDQHLAELIRQYGAWTYGILSAVVFCETGLVVTPFLPGDSLLFAAGALAANGSLRLAVLFPALLTAVVAGDNVNYWLGSRLGRRVFRPHARVLKTEYLERTERFYARHGGRAVVLARFLPIIRTYAPFVAGASRMPYRRFLAFSVAGALLWLSTFLVGGFLFGNVPAVKANFAWVIVIIVLLSALPAVVAFLKGRRSRRAPVAPRPATSGGRPEPLRHGPPELPGDA